MYATLARSPEIATAWADFDARHGAVSLVRACAPRRRNPQRAAAESPPGPPRSRPPTGSPRACAAFLPASPVLQDSPYPPTLRTIRAPRQGEAPTAASRLKAAATAVVATAASVSHAVIVAAAPAAATAAAAASSSLLSAVGLRDIPTASAAIWNGLNFVWIVENFTNAHVWVKALGARFGLGDKKIWGFSSDNVNTLAAYNSHVNPPNEPNRSVVFVAPRIGSNGNDQTEAAVTHAGYNKKCAK